MAGKPPVFENIEAPPSLKDIAFEKIKESILTHKLIPGHVYSEQAIAGELGISKTPVHQALNDLENMGFVKLLPRKGFQIMVLSKKDIDDLFEYRRALERAVIIHITEKLTDESIREIEAINAQAAKATDPIRFQKVDRQFHRYLISLSENRYIIRSLENVWDLCDWVGAEIFRHKYSIKEALSEHVDIAEVIKTRNVDAAVMAMKRHLKNSKKRYLSRVIRSEEEGN